MVPLKTVDQHRQGRTPMDPMEPPQEFSTMNEEEEEEKEEEEEEEKVRREEEEGKIRLSLY